MLVSFNHQLDTTWEDSPHKEFITSGWECLEGIALLAKGGRKIQPTVGGTSL